MIRPTIYEDLRRELGREPTHAEQVERVTRILREARDRAPHATERRRFRKALDLAQGPTTR